MADPDGNTYGPYDLEVEGSYAEEFSEEAYYRAHDESGVVSGGELTFDGLTAQLAAIHAYSHGSWLVRDDVWEDTSPATTTSAPRRDMLVLRRTRTVGEGETAVPGSTVPLVLHGTPATTPADPDWDEDADEPLYSWQVPGSGGTTVTNIKDLRQWVDESGRPFELIRQNTTSVAVTTAGLAEQRLAGPHNLVVPLRPGITYQAVARGLMESGGPASSIATTGVILRLARNAIPTPASSTVGEDRGYNLTSGTPGRAAFNAGEPFQVSAADIYHIHLFGIVHAGSTTGTTRMSVVPDRRGVFSLSLYRRGPAPAGLRTL